MSLLFNVLSRLIIVSKEQAPFSFIAAVTICCDFEAQENKVYHFLQEASSSIFAIRMVSSAYLNIWGYWYFSEQSWFQLVLHLAWHFAWCILHISFISGWQYTALTYSFPNLEPVSCSVSGSNCWFLTSIQISQEEGKMIWYSHLLHSTISTIYHPV